MLNASELADLTAEQTAALDKTGVVSRVTTTRSYSGQSETVTLIGTYPCRVAPYSRVGRGEEEIIAQRISTEMIWAITFPLGTVIKAEDRIVVNGLNTYEVIIPITPRSYEVAVRVACREVT